MATYPDNIQNIIELSDRLADQIERLDDHSCPPPDRDGCDPIDEALADLASALCALSEGMLYLLVATVITAQGAGDLRKLLNVFRALMECFPHQQQLMLYLHRHAAFIGKLLRSSLVAFEKFGIDAHLLFTPLHPELN